MKFELNILMTEALKSLNRCSVSYHIRKNIKITLKKLNLTIMKEVKIVGAY